LVRQLGEGGFGTVWLAEQEQPVRRQVALKFIKLGMDTKEVIARFEQERQALARMEHPGIARIFDAGATTDGRPFFAMELVDGCPLTEYCDRENLTIEERLRLFMVVCEAIQHAHQKGVIHRDIKPSNILVTQCDGRPVPKVIDFGVAKATQGLRLINDTPVTLLSQWIGTPLYMSPEQADIGGLDTDTRSDLYSLGVLLYELLAGRLPFAFEDLAGKGWEEIRRTIREEEPLRMSAVLRAMPEPALAQTARRRQREPARLIELLRGDLDRIVGKALEKDREHRYQTASAFLEDIQRYFAHQPVLAARPSAGYKLGKFLRRNRTAVSLSAALLILLVGGIVVSSKEAWRANRAEMLAENRLHAVVAESEAKEKALQQALEKEQEARVAEADTKAFGKFLVEGVLAAARPKDVQDGLGYDVTVVRALEEAEKNLEMDFVHQPRAEALARHAIGVTWRNLGRYDQGERHLRRAVELRERELGLDDESTLDSRNSLGVLLNDAGRYSAALPINEVTFERLKKKLGPNHPETLNSMNTLAASFKGTNQMDKALSLIEETFSRNSETLGPNAPQTLLSMHNLAITYRHNQQYGKALELAEETYERAKENLGPDDPNLFLTKKLLGELYLETGRPTQGISFMEKSVAEFSARFGKDHPWSRDFAENLRVAYRQMGRMEHAAALAKDYALDEEKKVSSVKLKEFQRTFVPTGVVSSLAISNDGNFLYATGPGAKTVAGFRRDVKTGELKWEETGLPPLTAAPAAIRLSRDGEYGVGCEFLDGVVTLFKRDRTTGRLEVLDTARDGQDGVEGLNRVHDAGFSSDNRFVYAAASEGVSVFRLENGKLSFVEYRKGPMEEVRGCELSPNGRWIYAPASRSGTLGVLRRDEDTGRLEVVQILADGKDGVSHLAGVFRVAASSDGKHVYVSAGRFGGDQAVSAFEVQPDGKLKLFQEFVNGKDGFNEFDGGNEIKVSPDGKSVFVVASLSDRLFRFSRDPQSGKLAFITSQQAGILRKPGSAGLCFSPDGKFVYVADGDAGSIVALRLPEDSLLPPK
jgi:6-phosphogluconolactonase (cycloisomerase 2 family)/tetratricopeptide (TPR) repeat protein